MHLDQIVPVLQLSIGPVILISGIGLVLLSMTNRFGRVIDRTRIMADMKRSDDEQIAECAAKQIGILIIRARLMRHAIALTSVSILFAAILIITLFILALIHFEAAFLIFIIFTLCIVSLIAGLVFFIKDINLSLSALKLEIGAGDK